VDLNAVEMFVSVVQAGSLSAGATRMGLPLPKVSRRVRDLERQLNVQLLERSARGTRLTDAGARLYEHAGRGIEALHEAMVARRVLAYRPVLVAGRTLVERLGLPDTVEALHRFPCAAWSSGANASAPGSWARRRSRRAACSPPTTMRICGTVRWRVTSSPSCRLSWRRPHCAPANSSPCCLASHCLSNSCTFCTHRTRTHPPSFGRIWTSASGICRRSLLADLNVRFWLTAAVSLDDSRTYGSGAALNL
jgi:DNA-binding transcriptional LysR family regulator